MAWGSLINNIMTHADSSLYTSFHRLRLTTSRRHFSSRWLGKADNYLCLRGEREVSCQVMVGLFQRLWREGRLLLAIRVGWTILWLPEGQR